MPIFLFSSRFYSKTGGGQGRGGVDILNKSYIIVFSILYLESKFRSIKKKQKEGIGMVEIIEHVRLAEKVYEKIKDKILEEDLSPGTRLISDQLAEEMGVSRTPVKEALLRLEKEGFVVSIPRRGIYVKKFSLAEIKEIYEIREVLEGLAVRMAAVSPDPELLEKMRQACENYKLGIEQKDAGLCVENDLLFHRLLVKASGSKRLVDILESFHAQSISIAKKGISYWTYAPTYLNEHRRILDLVSKKEARLAEKEIKKHIRKGKERISK